MKIAVTGCNGRIGRRVVLLALKQGHTIVGIDSASIPRASPEESEIDFLANTAFTFRQIDVREYDQVIDALNGCDAVIQLAGQPNPSKDNPAVAHNLNVVITWNVLQAAAELNIRRIAQASSVNAIGMVFNESRRFRQFPIDESHPCEPDEQYGLSKLICEMQADALLRRYPSTRIASLRLHWSIPTRDYPTRFTPNPARNAADLWGYVQEDEGAKAFLLTISPENDSKWSGHEVFLIAAPETRGMREEEARDSDVLKKMWWPDVPCREGWRLQGRASFFDCSKAERLLGWKHAPA
ncbi:NAD(P)-binding protein [Neolentinus lepideus HHB14362 ss-1]|uniref:NAD(P)-binding protein n=1 Tax=Neolentinus lepideus HHB14362 ss-1 TaxID=1314782 RepID=A0A165VIE2_9AGAM|nr:NAD(P)-binding protein [Neolentinus lepideus HHB14362 ss-1]